MSKLIKAFVTVPSGPDCHYKAGPCDHLEFDKKTGRGYCTVFHDRELLKYPGADREFIKCTACERACKEAVDDEY